MSEEDQPEAVVESLRQERLHVQKKTFTKWANIHLQKFGLQIDDLFQDMGDGLKLMRLLEALSGEKLGKPAKGTARIKKIENVSRCLMFLHSKKMRLENISSEDIVDGKPHLILGLLWMIILRYEIPPETSTSVMLPSTHEEPKVPGPKIAKDSLLLWCQTKTNGYPRVYVRDFHRSWRDGLAFNALIHSHVPSLVDFNSLKQEEHIHNLENAFSIAQKQIGVPRLLDPEDVDTDNPDEKSILVYVSTFCKGLGKYREEMTSGKRITYVINKKMETDKLKKNYIETASKLLEWIYSQVENFKSKQNLKSLEDIQEEIASFKNYRVEEKPKQSEKKNELEVLYFTIQMQRLGQSGWIPPEKVSPAAIEKAWSELQRAEHEHEISIRNQLKDQERLENLAYKFETKRAVREGYINDIQKILTDPNYGASLKQSDATFKKHEAIRTGILAREIMIQDLFKIADVLIESNYRKKDDIMIWKQNTEEKWNYLLRLLEAFDEKFSYLREVISTLEEMDSIHQEMQQLQTEMNPETVPLDVTSSLQQHDLKEVQIASWAEAVHRFEKKVEKEGKVKDTNILQVQVKKLRKTYENLIESSRNYREMLEKEFKAKEHNEYVEEMLAWIFEKQLYCTSDLNCKDLASAILLQKKHKALGSELILKKELIENMEDERLKTAILDLEVKWTEKEKNISLAVEAYQYIRDAEECSSWISENMHLLSTLDCGTDELTCEALLRRHAHTEEKIVAYSVEIKSLREQSEKICLSLQNFSRECDRKKTKKSFEKKFTNDFHSDSNLSSENISSMQRNIEKCYKDLEKKCQERKTRLQQSSMFFNFKDRCDEVEKWMREKERVVDTNDFGSESEEIEKNFEEFLTDMIAHGLIIEELASVTHQLEEGKAKEANTARMLFEDIQRRWQHLNQQIRLKEQNLKGHTSLLLAHRTCEATITLLNETLLTEKVDTVENITSFEELRRRQEAIKRELNMAEERVKQAYVLSENVSNSYPEQKGSLQARLQVLGDQWEKFKVKMKQRQQRLDQDATVQIFNSKANYLIEWSNDVMNKLRMREKISDLGIAQSVAKDHKDIGDEMDMQNYRFAEIEELGAVVSKKHPDVKQVMKQITEAKKTIHKLWEEKYIWISENMDLQIFDREANHLQSICANQNKLLDTADSGETLSDVEIMIRHHDSFMDTLKVQKNRFLAFNEMADRLLETDREQREYIQMKKQEINELRENVLQKANERSLRLQQDYFLQEFKVEAQEMIDWITEKSKRALNLLEADTSINLSSKIKRLESLEAELTANATRLQNVYAKGEKLCEECSFARLDLEKILEDLENAWNLLCERIELNRQSLYGANDLNDLTALAEMIGKKLDEIKQVAESSSSGNDLRVVKNLLKTQENLENDLEKLKEKIASLIDAGQKLIEEANKDEIFIKDSILKVEQKLQETQLPLTARREKLETCFKFHQFKSEVERELMWISEQKALLSADTQCKNLLEAQKSLKKLENLEVTMEYHQKIVQKLAKEVLVLVAEKECIVDVTKTCGQMEDEWNKLIEIFNDKKIKTNFTLKAQMFYSEANEIDAWISEKKQILSSTDYGKDEDMVIKLLTKQKDIELEVDSYKGLVEELAHQADNLIETKNPDAKIIKSRMEMIGQEMKNLQSLSLTRRQKLLETKDEWEFEKETEELDIWINEQMSHATSEDFGEDYEHVLMIHTNFEFYRSRVEAGSKRIIQYEEFAKRLINSKCSFTERVTERLQYLSARWSELIESLEARAFKLEAAAEIHRYHRDVTDILARINGYYRALPSDLGSSLAHAQQLAKKHDATENELLGIEAQLHLLVDDSRRLQEAYPGGNEEHIQMQLALVIENWNSLQQKVASRKENLIASQRIHKFLSLVREEENWSKQMCFELESENIPRDLEQIENQHHISLIEIEARLSKYENLRIDGESLLVFNLFHKQIDEKLQILSEIEERVKKSWAARCDLITRTKAVILFFIEAKQIQTSLATREVQLCGSETKETVEDLESALKKHLEFQKSMKIQEEKFLIWEEQGRSLLKQNVPESERIEKKLEDLCSRRKRLLNFSIERSEAYSNSLHLAKFKRDTIEEETWIKEKKNKLKTLLKDYNQLNADEKIKCLQKQQAIQAEIESHEPIIQRIIQQKKEVTSPGEELNLRVELILENWDEVKSNVERMGRDLKDAQDMLIMHGYFEKAETWIKEKELLIQKNDPGKDYEHCLSLQMKLDDNISGAKVDEEFFKNMQQLAKKLSGKENENGVYVRYERIHEKWNYLKEEIALYRNKLHNAAEVHAFIKDVDDTIDRIREKSMLLSVRDDVRELSAVEMVYRKLEDTEKELTIVDKKISEQCRQGESLAQKYELSSGQISDKLSQVNREQQELKKDLERKKSQMSAIYKSLKFMKDVEDMEKIVSDLTKEMEYGEEPTDSADAISFLEAHHHYEVQITSCQEKIKSLEERGTNVLKISGVLMEEVNNCMGILTVMRKNIRSSWNNRLNFLTKSRDIHIFYEKAKQIETWFASKEAFLANEDVGDSMSSVEALIRKHENFENSCNTYFEKLHELETLLSDLRGIEEFEEIENYFTEISQRRVRLQETCKNRKKILHDSKALQELLLQVYEVTNWMNEKIQVVSDDSYKDLTNLLSKTKKHATLEAEILANHSRVVSITTQADDMLKDEHFASEEIRQGMQNLEDMWQKLLNLTNEQKIKLNDAYNALKFKQKLEDINGWLDEAESQIELDDYILDVAAIQQEIDKLEDIEKDMQEIGDKIRHLNEVSEKFEHSSKEEILRTFYSTEERFRAVVDSITKKYSKLQEDLSLAGLDKDINDELSWIEESLAICQSEEYFDDVISVQILQKKLEALETEIRSREPLINSIVERGTRLDSSSAESKGKHLENRFQELKDSISLRRLRLSDALESQTYYFEVTQAEIWMKEKMAQISGCDSGTDLFSVKEIKKKMSAIEAAITGFKENIAGLEDLSSNLIRRGHYDSDNIRIKQEDLNNHYEQLTCSILKKIAILQEDEEFFAYYRDVNAVISQLKSITAATNSSDTGRDLEHVESLLQKLEILRSKQCAQEKTVKVLQQRANTLIDGGHTDASKIQELLVSLEDAWLECDYSAESRFKTLEQAKLYHSFKKSADETISWIYEKDVALSSDNYGHDLQSIETLLRHHETLEGDLKAIQEQVDALSEEATMLSAQFLDYKDSLEEKFNDVTEAYERCCQKAFERKEKLLQAQQLQTYFEEARDFQAWIREMSAMITQIDLPQDVAACEAVLAQHDGYKSEIDSEMLSFRRFEKRGQDIITSGHFMAPDIQERLQGLTSSFDNLQSLWKSKRRTHEQNLDLQLFKKKLKELDKWLQGQEYYLVKEEGRSLEEVDYLLRKHEQLEQKLDLYETKFQELLNTTKIEEELQRKKEGDELKRNEELIIEEQRKLQEIRKKEEERLLEERRKERLSIDSQQEGISDDDFLYHDTSPRKESFFKPYGSKRSFPNRNQHQISARPQTPVISRKLTVSSLSSSTSIVPPTTAEGFLQRKQETQSGGKRSTSRGWKTHYTVLCGQLLCFFKDKKSFIDKNAAKPPINILGARCYLPRDYRKKKYVFRLEPTDNSSYLFEAPNEIKRDEWVKKINYAASLHPSMQLMTAFDDQDSRLSHKNDDAVDERDKWTDPEEQDEEYTTRSYRNNSLYDDIHHDIDAVHNPIYAASSVSSVSERSDTLRSYDSARSSLSNPSSYRTALAASSTSTLQDDHIESSGDENVYSLPEPLSRARSEVSLDPAEHEMVRKQMSLPRETGIRKRDSKKRWNVFNLRRRSTNH